MRAYDIADPIRHRAVAWYPPSACCSIPPTSSARSWPVVRRRLRFNYSGGNRAASAHTQQPRALRHARPPRRLRFPDPAAAGLSRDARPDVGCAHGADRLRRHPGRNHLRSACLRDHLSRRTPSARSRWSRAPTPWSASAPRRSSPRREILATGGKAGRVPEYWDGRCAERIAAHLRLARRGEATTPAPGVEVAARITNAAHLRRRGLLPGLRARAAFSARAVGQRSLPRRGNASIDPRVARRPRARAAPSSPWAGSPSAIPAWCAASPPPATRWPATATRTSAPAT